MKTTPADNSSRPSLLRPLYRLAGTLAGSSASRQLNAFKKNLSNPKQVQNQLLAQILQINQPSDFGQDHNFKSIKTYSDFTHALPPATYEYHQPYIQRCLNGQPHALLGPTEKLLMFALTSGTTAPAKHIPVTARSIAHYRTGWNIWGIKTLSDHPNAWLRKILQITSPHNQSYSPAGLPCGAISGMIANHQKWIVRKFYATPYKTAFISDAPSRYYTILRLAITKNIAFISTANPSTILAMADIALQHPDDLIRDIHDGSLTNAMQIPDPIRNELKKHLHPNHARAQELRLILKKHNQLLPKHYWNLSFLAHWTGGTLSLYLPRIRDLFGHIPIRDIGLLASEARITIPFNDNTPSGVLDIQANLYEFVPAEQIDNLPDPHTKTLPTDLTFIRPHQLQEGEEYYILLTTTAGLYRYHIGDRVRVTGFLQKTPLIEFLSKGDHTSSLTGEKLTEHQLIHAVAQTNLKLDLFIMAPIWDSIPFYRLYAPCPDLQKKQQLEQTLDQQLQLTNMEYASKRKTNRLAPIEWVPTEEKTLKKQDNELREKNYGRAEQFKHRYLHNQPLTINQSPFQKDIAT